MEFNANKQKGGLNLTKNKYDHDDIERLMEDIVGRPKDERKEYVGAITDEENEEYKSTVKKAKELSNRFKKLMIEKERLNLEKRVWWNKIEEKYRLEGKDLEIDVERGKLYKITEIE